MTTEETIDKVRLLAKQRCRRNIKEMTLLSIFAGILCAGMYCGLFYIWSNRRDWWIDIPVIFFVACSVFLFLGLLGTLLLEKNNYRRVETLIRICDGHYSFFDRGCVFKDYGFYEAAIEDFDEALKYFNKESEQIAESLIKFFDEYNAQTKLVNGIHRPVPNFRNHDWLWLRQFYLERKIALRSWENQKKPKPQPNI
jgi:hypothetical protein